MSRKTRWTAVAVLAGALLLVGYVVTRDADTARVEAVEGVTPAGDSAAPLAREATLPSPADVQADARVEPEAAVVGRDTPRPRFFGRVTDPAGAPVEGAEVTIEGASDGPGGARVHASSTSDAAGRFEILLPAEAHSRSPDVEPAYRCTVAAWGLSQTVSPVVPEQELELRVPWASALFGTVREAESGEPLAGVKIRWGDAETVSDARGRYRLEPVRFGSRVTVHATRDGYVECTARRVVTERAGERMDLELERGVQLTWVVQDVETGAPVAGASVRTARHRPPLAVADAQGRVTFRAPGDGELAFEVDAEGHATLRWRMDARDVATEDEDEEQVLPLTRLGRIEGLARDRAGDLVPEARAYADCPEHSFDRHPVPDVPRQTASWRVPRELTLDATDGGFAVPVVPCPSPYTVHVFAVGYARSSAQVVVAMPDQVGRVEVTLHSGATVRGTVFCDGEPWKREGGEVRLLDVDGGFVARVDVQPDGSYEATEVPPGRIELRVRDHPTTHVDGLWIDVVEGAETVQDITFALGLASIRGRVTSSDGLPVVGASVTALAPDGRGFFHARTAEDGSYVLEVESAARYTVQVFRKPVSRRRDGVAAGAENVDFVLPATGELSLRLVDAETRQPLAIGHEVFVFHWRMHGDPAFAPLMLEHGERTVQTFAMPVGTIDMRVHWASEGYRPVTVSGIEVGEEPGEPVEIELVRGLEADFRFEGEPAPDGTDVSGASWWKDHLLFVLEQSQLGHVDGPFDQQGGPSNQRINGINVWIESSSLIQQLVYPDEQGRASLTGLAAGRYSIVCIPDDFVFEPGAFELTPGTAGPVAIRWRRR